MSLKQNMRVALAQMTANDSIADNLKIILSNIKEAAGQGAQLVIFPENSLYLRLSSAEPMVNFNLNGDESFVLAQAVSDLKIHVLLTTPTEAGGGKSRNSTIHFSPTHGVKIVYSKIHMFDVEVEGAPPVRESERFVSGEAPAIIEIGDWKFGLSICYDLRFPELYMHYADQVDVILVPSAFLVPTGQAHWHILNRARAIENQCYVLSPAQCGEHKSKSGVTRKTYGHSLVIDPWGHVDLDIDSGPTVRTVELEAKKLAWVRKQIPMQHHRRMLRSKNKELP